MRISVFSTGRVRRKRDERGVWRYLVNDWSENTLPVNVFLIEHPEGLCLVDSGQTAEAAKKGYFAQWYPFFRLSRFELSTADEAANQIVRAGFDLRDVRWVVLTHLHTDHVGGIGAFGSSKVLVTRREWNVAQGFRGRVWGYLPHRWPANFQPTTIDFSGPPIGPFQSSYDIDSDCTLTYVPLPGHTRGHAALLVRGKRAPWYLCAGDVTLRAAELAAVAPDVADWCRRENVVVLTTHDDAAAGMIGDSLWGAT